MSSDNVEQLSLQRGSEVQSLIADWPASVEFRLETGYRRFSLRGDKDALRKAIFDLPTEIGTSRISKTQKSLCLGPDEWLIIADNEEATDLEKSLDATAATEPFSLVEISHRNVGFSLRSESVVEILIIGCPLDLAQFEVGKCTRTIFERAEIVLAKTGEDEFYIECWRSYAPYVMGLIGKAAEVLE